MTASVSGLVSTRRSHRHAILQVVRSRIRQNAGFAGFARVLVNAATARSCTLIERATWSHQAFGPVNFPIQQVLIVHPFDDSRKGRRPDVRQMASEGGPRPQLIAATLGVVSIDGILGNSFPTMVQRP